VTESVELPGPWTHRTVAARGARFHVTEQGTGPLIVLLHGFPLFWWTWRRQIPELAAAGYRVAAMDLRGVGGSDHTPRGYDLPSLADDVAGVIRSLGAADAVVVGQGWGGLVGWTLAATQPDVVHRLAVVGAAHPGRLRRAAVTDPKQAKALAFAARMQPPWLPERRLVRHSGAYVGQLIDAWSGLSWDEPSAKDQFRAAMQLGNTAYCTAEYYRWAVRSLFRPDGFAYSRRVSVPIDVPVLQVHGEADRYVLSRTAEGSGRYVHGDYRWVGLPGVGHFPQEERPAELTQLLLDWLADTAAAT
jgi:pimeloyl-ACP methyl ester carboxylesterase